MGSGGERETNRQRGQCAVDRKDCNGNYAYSKASVALQSQAFRLSGRYSYILGASMFLNRSTAAPRSEALLRWEHFILIKTFVAKIPATAQGIALMFFATLCFTAMQTGVRIVAADPTNPLPPLELAFLRNAFGVVALLPVFFRSGLTVMKTRRMKLHFTRAAVQALGMMCFFTGLLLIPFAEVTALSFSAPLFATVLAIIVMGERVRIRRISAVGHRFHRCADRAAPWCRGAELGRLADPWLVAVMGSGNDDDQITVAH